MSQKSRFQQQDKIPQNDIQKQYLKKVLKLTKILFRSVSITTNTDFYS